MGHSPKVNSKKRDLSQHGLSSGTSITLMTTGSSRICSHQ